MKLSNSSKARLATTCDDIIGKFVNTRGDTRIPGVVAAVTTKDGLLYETAQGMADITTNAPMTKDTIFCFYSATKIITAVACMQLYEQGRLDLDAPAEHYHPDIGKIRVLTGFGASGQPLTKAPDQKVTVRMMLSHTAGFSYAFFNASHLRVMKALKKVPLDDVISDVPLVAEPGSKWAYGNGIDWAGKVVESITGMRLGEYFSRYIFQPLGMDSCTFQITTAAQIERLATPHQRIPGKTALGLSRVVPLREPKTDMGGQGVFGTVDDYAKFIRMFLNDGKTDTGASILKPETIRYGAANQLPKEFAITPLVSSLPHVTNEIHFFPETPKSHSLFAMRTDAPTKTGRAAGTLMWAGLANLFFWIDMEKGVGGFWATQLLPFGDQPSIECCFAVEAAVYAALGEAAKL